MWFLSGAQPRGTFTVFLLAGVGLSAVFTVLVGASRQVAAGIALGALVLVPFTASRGGGSGLWLLIVPLLIVAALAFMAVGASIERVWPRPLLKRAAYRAGIAAISLVIGGTGIVHFWPDPFPRLVATAKGLADPSWRLVGVTRAGDVLCSYACGPRVTLEYATLRSRASTCEALQTILSVHGMHVTLPGRCAVQGTVALHGYAKGLVNATIGPDRSRINVFLTLEGTR